MVVGISWGMMTPEQRYLLDLQGVRPLSKHTACWAREMLCALSPALARRSAAAAATARVRAPRYHLLLPASRSACLTPLSSHLLLLSQFLVVEDALSADELGAARDAMDRYASGIFGTGPPLPDSWYPGCAEEHTCDGVEKQGKEFEGHLKCECPRARAQPFASTRCDALTG